MLKEKITWETIAIAYAKAFVAETDRKMFIEPELIKELKAKGFYDKLSPYIK